MRMQKHHAERESQLEFDRRALEIFIAKYRGEKPAIDIDIKRYESWESGVLRQGRKGDPELLREKAGILLVKAKLGDEVALDKVVKSNMGLIIKEASMYNTGATEIGELMQEGSIGLVIAIQNFNFERDIRFSSYAVSWIKQRISRFAKNRSIIQIPEYRIDEINGLEKVTEQYIAENGVMPTSKELSSILEISKLRVSNIRKSKLDMVSLDAPVSANKSALHDLVRSGDKGPEQELLNKERNMLLNNALKHLSHPAHRGWPSRPKREGVMRMRFLIPYSDPITSEERNVNLKIQEAAKSPEIKNATSSSGERLMAMEKIGSYFGISREGVRQILKGSMAEIKEYMRAYMLSNGTDKALHSSLRKTHP